MQQQVFVGIDVSKVQLEVALSTGEGFAVVNDKGGIAELVRRLRTAAPKLVVLEASDYERAAWIALWEAGLAMARVNPRDSYHFAQARRRLAKTDRSRRQEIEIASSYGKPTILIAREGSPFPG